MLPAILFFSHRFSVSVDFSGSGASMDIVVSSVRAYLSALNKICSFAGAVKASSEVPEIASVPSTE
jgi:2-isopropylmalate synthase